MATRKRDGNIALDAQPGPDHPLPPGVLEGHLKRVGGKYELKFGRSTVSFEPGETMSSAELSKLAGKKGRDVAVAVTGSRKKSIVAIGTWPTPEVPRPFKTPWIVCYLPNPHMMRKVNPYIRAQLLFALENEGIISGEVAAMVQAGMRKG